MAAERSHPTVQLNDRSSSIHSDGDEALSKWLAFSFVVHGLFIASLFVVPFLPSRSGPSYPIYTVDLVGGDKIGGMKLGTELTPSPPQKQKAEKVQSEPPAPVVETKKETKREKSKAVEKVASVPEKAIVKEVAKKEPAKETKSESKTEEGLSGSLREKLIQAALDRVKDRAGTGQKPGTPKGEVISAGPGEGEGAAAVGPGGRGGGVVKGAEFILYQNKMLSMVRENWTWAGHRTDLKTTVQFGIRDNGEIVGLKIVQASGDSSYDDSVVRAVRKSSPLPAPPDSYRKDFMDVELTFRPKDLGGTGR